MSAFAITASIFAATLATSSIDPDPLPLTPRRRVPHVREQKPSPTAPAAPTPNRVSSVWWALGECESGNNPRAINPSGKYRGAFQFDLSTWASVGESGDPIDRSYAHQLAAAQRLHAQRGFYPWPQCARSLGLI